MSFHQGFGLRSFKVRLPRESVQREDVKSIDRRLSGGILGLF